MNKLLRLFSFGAFLAGLSLSLNATTYTLSGSYASGGSQSWSVSTPASTSISASISLTAVNEPFANLFGVTQLAPTGGSPVFSVTASGTRTASNSGSASGLAAGDYTLSDFFYTPNKPGALINANMSATITW